VELVRRRGLLLCGDDATDGGRIASIDHDPVLGRREAGCEMRSRGARALK
jgi:hypothetical protein